jgi:hypothetical protein
VLFDDAAAACCGAAVNGNQHPAFAGSVDERLDSCGDACQGEDFAETPGSQRQGRLMAKLANVARPVAGDEEDIFGGDCCTRCRHVFSMENSVRMLFRAGIADPLEMSCRSL